MDKRKRERGEEREVEKRGKIRKVARKTKKL